MSEAIDWLGDDTVFEDLACAFDEGLRPEPGPWRPGGALSKAWTGWEAACLALELVGLADILGLVGDPEVVLGDSPVGRAFGARATHRPPSVDAAFIARRQAATASTTPDASWRRRHERNLERARRGERPDDHEALWLVHGTAGHLAAAHAAGVPWSPHPIRGLVLGARHAPVIARIPSIALEALAAANDNERAFEAARSWRDVNLTTRERLAEAIAGDEGARDALAEALNDRRPGTLEIRELEHLWSRPPVDGEDPERPIEESARVLVVTTRVERPGVDLVDRWLRGFGEWRGAVREGVLAMVRPVEMRA